MMRTKYTIHWAAPALMLGSLLTGAVLAIGHHLFYQALDGSQVSKGTYSLLGSSISTQELNIAVGTALAFLVKTSLCLSISASFVQLFWRNAKADHRSRPMTLSKLDYLYSALGNVFTLCNVSLWSSFPLLLFVALVAWLTPIASVITPATLSVQLMATVSSSLHKVPNLDFRSLSFLAPMLGTGSPIHNRTTGRYDYNGPGQAVLEIANAVMSAGSILPISSPLSNANTSWQITFLGPALKCSHVNSTMHLQMRKNIHDYMNQNLYQRQYGFLAWSPNYGYWNGKLTEDFPFLSNKGREHLSFKPIDTVFGGSMLYSTNPDVLFYVAISPSIFGIEYDVMLNALNRPNETVPSWIDGLFLACQAFESNYSVTFKYRTESTQVNIEHILVNTSQPIQPLVDIVGPNPQFNDVNGCEESDATGKPAKKDCYTNPEVLRTLSYQAVMDAFGRNLVGSVYMGWSADLKRDSLVLNTALTNTKEMSFLRNSQAYRALKYLRTLQDAILQSNLTMTKGILNNKDRVIDMPLHLALEQMFENVTVSLMSSPALQPNTSSITAPPPTNVTITSVENIYVYATWRLWLPYGIAILLTTLAATTGLATMFLNDASYSSNFSTVFRVARITTIDAPIEKDEDLNGKDPLPKYLSKANLWLA